ncbi:MAG: ABC transporter substrate-binding protein [Proteobacteria bacterium]|nr:ABC transporter substrate-binding protein [Pseudomonadota bacterium]MDA0994038.1 ABC transporter substrate-binding protein [Pseudomonadota bacterium]
MKRIITGLAIIFLGTIAFAADPNDVIQSATDELAVELEGRKAELKENKDELYALIDKILLPRFDRRYAAQLVLGRHWRTASGEQRDNFIDVFYRSLLRRYSDGVLEFDQDRVELLPFRDDDTKDRTVVKSIVSLEDGTKVPVNYGMVLRDGGWLMFDVTIEGISYVRNFRTELNSEIQSSSLDAVIARLESETRSN